MADNTNINENEAVNSQNEAVANEPAASEKTVLKAEQMDSAQLAYIIYARKYKRKLQAEERRKAKEKAALEAAEKENAENAAAPEVAEPKADEPTQPILETAENTPAAEAPVAEAPAAEESAVEEPAAEEPAEEAAVAEEPVAEEPATENDNSTESEREVAPVSEPMPKSWEDDMVGMVISIDVEAEKAAENAENDAEQAPAPENTAPTPDPFNPANSAFGGFGAPVFPQAAPAEEDDGKLIIRIDEQIKQDENLISIDAVSYPEAAFDSIMQERAALTQAIDNHYRAYAAEMERLRQKHMYMRMNEAAKACAERSEEFKLLEAEEARYNREVEELTRRRDEAAKAYLDRKAELERIIGEYDARGEELADAEKAIQKIASGAADVTSAMAAGIAQGRLDGAPTAAAPTEKPLEEAKPAEEVKPAAEEKPAEEVKPAAEEKPAEEKPEVQSDGSHVVVPGAIDKAYDDAELQKKLSKYRDERRKKADVDLKNLSAFIAAAQKDIAALDKEYKELEAKKPDTEADAVVNAVDRLSVKRRTVEKMTDKLLACKEAGAPEAVCQKHADELNSAAAQYNAVVDEYKALTGHTLTPAQSDMADRILKGEEYRLLPVITARREVVSKEDGLPIDKISPSDAIAAPLKVETVVGGEHQLTEEQPKPKAKKAKTEQKQPEQEVKAPAAPVTMTEKEIPKFFKEQKKKEEKLMERDRVLAALNPDGTEDKVVVLVERIGTQRELIAAQSKDLKLAVKTNDKKRIRSSKKQLEASIDKYNELADEYTSLTGDSLTKADENIPEYIIKNEKYKALPVISYRKESPDGTLLSDRRGAGTTCGAAYSLIPEKERKELERRGVIEKARATAITGLSRKEAKRKLKEEKENLKREAAELTASAKENARLAKEEAKLAKRGPKAERAEHKAAALEYANKSAADSALAEEKAKTEKELKTLKDFEEYLLAKEAAGEPVQAKAAPAEQVAPAEVAPEAQTREPTKETRELENYRNLSNKQKREKLKAEKAALLAAAQACEAQAELDAQSAKTEKKLSKSGDRVERAEHKALAEEYKEASENSTKEAEQLKKTAKSLKNTNDLEKLLEERAERAEREAACGIEPLEQSGAEEAAVAPAAAELENYRKLSKKEKREKFKEEKAALLAEAKACDEQAELDALRAKEEKKLSKSGTRAERAEHREQAEEFKESSEKSADRSAELKKTAKALKTQNDYEKYLEQKAQEQAALGTTAEDAELAAYEQHLAKKHPEAAEEQLAPAAAALEAFRRLSKKEKRKRIKEEKAALLTEAKAYEEQAELDALRAKEEKKLSKSGTRAERAAHKAQAAELKESSEKSAERAKELRNTAKSIKNEADYEKYLEQNAMEEEALRSLSEIAGVSADDKKPESKSGEAAKKAVDTTELDNFKKLSKKEKREKLKEERAALLAEAKAYEEQAIFDAAKAKEEKKLSKSGSRAERAEHKDQAFEHAKGAEDSTERAKLSKEAAKALKNERDFERYLRRKTENEAALREEREAAELAAYGAALAAKQPSEKAPEVSELDSYKLLSKKEKRQQLKEERAALLAEAKAYEEQASFDAEKAKEEKKLSKSGSRAERAEHKKLAIEHSKSAEAAAESAKESKRAAKALKNERDFEKYLEKKAEREATLREDREAAELAAYGAALAAKQRVSSSYVAESQGTTELDSFKKLSKREKKARIKQEKLALLAEARANDEDAKYAAKRAKEEAKLAKRGSRAQRAAHAEEAERLSHESERLSASAKDNAKTAKEIQNVRAYEKHLAAKAVSGEKKMASAASQDAYNKQVESKDLRRERGAAVSDEDRYTEALMRKAEREDAEKFAADHELEMLAFAGLSRKEKKALIKEEREKLNDRAEELEKESKASARQAEDVKAFAKSGSRREKAEAKAQAKALKAKSAEQKRLAKRTRKQAHDLKSVSDYEKHLAQKAKEEKSQPAPAAEAVATKSEYDIDTRLFDKSLSRKALKAEAKRRRLEFLREAERLEREAKEEERRAKEERLLAKTAKRSDKPIHKSEAEAYTKRSRKLKEQAGEAKLEAKELKELKTLEAFEAYNAKKEALAAERNLAPEKRERDFADADKLIRHNRGAIEKFCREQSEYDEMMMKRRYETKAAALRTEIEIQKLHFGEKKSKHVKRYSSLKKQLAQVQKHIPKAMKAEKADNERYYAAIRCDVEKMRLPKRTDRSKLTKLQIEIESLLKERDAINRELTALYSSNKSADAGRNNTYERLKTAEKGAKSAYKKQRKLANEVDSMDISIDEKEKIFDPMNRITQLNAEIKDLTYRIEREKLKGRAKKSVISTIKKKKAERAHLEKKVKTLSNKARVKSFGRRADRKERITWIIVLIAIVAVCALGYYFREQILGYIVGLLPESISGLVGSLLGGANNG